MKLRLLLTGNELMAGDIIDSNSAMIAEVLAPLGWRIEQKITVGDELALLCQQMEWLCQDADVLIINGGLGPTVDDLTSLALTQLTGRPTEEHPAALCHLEQWCSQRGFSANGANRKQAMLPSGCDIIANARGSAVGIRLVHNNCLVLATPGVPSELRQMMQEEILPLLIENFPSDKIRTRRLGTFGLGESSIQQLISTTLPDWPDSIELGFRASMPVLEVKLTARGDVKDEQIQRWQDKVVSLLGAHYIGTVPTGLAEALIKLSRDKNLRLCTAESCTGGLIASQITAVAGASDVFAGGIVCYSNAMKADLLGVDRALLEEHGAVSESVVRAMAEGALKAAKADIVIAVTGIAGPGGGTEEKPVGTVWIAWGSLKHLQTVQLQLPFDRQWFQTWATATGLDLLRRHLSGVTEHANLINRFAV